MSRDQSQAIDIKEHDGSFGVRKTSLFLDNGAGGLTRASGDTAGNVNVNIVSGTITGSNGAILDGVDSNIKATVKDLTNSNPVTVAIVDGSGDQITSFGGGTQYTEGDTDATITGTAMLMEGAGNSLVPAQGTATDGLLVNLGTNNDVTITSSALPTGAATESTLSTLNSKITTCDTGAVTITSLPNEGQQTMANSISVAIASNQSAVPVSGTFWQTTQPVSIASAVPVTDNSGSLTVDAPVATPVFVRLSDGASAISTLPVSLASVPSHAVTNAGTFAVQVDGSALTSLQLIDDTVYTDDTSTHSTGSSKGIGIMAAATPTDVSVNANDIGMLAMTTDRRLLVDASGVAVPVTDNSGSLTVDNNGTFAVQSTPVLATSASASTPASAVSVTTSSTTIISSNASRRFFAMRNAGTEVIYFRLASSGATTSDMPLYPQDYFELPQMNIYTGAVVGISGGTTQSIRIIEY